MILELIDKREAIVARFNELSEAVQPLLDAVVTEDAARLIEHQRQLDFGNYLIDMIEIVFRNSDSMLALDFLQKKFNVSLFGHIKYIRKIN